MDAFAPELNICPIAGNCLGVKRSEETKARLSSVRMGRRLSDDHKSAISESLKGHVVSEETRGKLKNNGGWKHSEATKEKMRGRSRTQRQIDSARQRLIGNKHCLGRKASPQQLEKMAMAAREQMAMPGMKEQVAAKLRGNKNAEGHKVSSESRQRMREKALLREALKRESRDNLSK